MSTVLLMARTRWSALLHCFFLFFFELAHDMQKFLGQGSITLEPQQRQCQILNPLSLGTPRLLLFGFWVCVCDLQHNSQQCQILNPLSRIGDGTHILMDTGWVYYCWVTRRTPLDCFFFFFFFCLFAISWAVPVAYGGSQAGGLIGAIATSLCQSHSNTRSEPRLQPTPQLMVMLDP